VVINSGDTSRPLGAGATCRFCSLQQFEELIGRTSSTVTVPSVGAFIEGWSLVLPTTHVTSLAQLGRGSANDFEAALIDSQALVQHHYGQTVMFEHGSESAARSAGCGVDHAHAHIVPGHFNLRVAIHDWGGLRGELSWTASPRPYVVHGGSDYLWVSDHTGGWLARHPHLPSQVVRQALGKVLDEVVWDWKAEPRVTIVERTRGVLLGR